MGLDCQGFQLLGEPASLYCDPAVRSVLRALLDSGSPLTSAQLSRIAGGGDLPGALKGILRVSGVSYRALDPVTGDFEFLAKLSCPFCGSQDLRRDELVEHTGCGYVGRLSEFGPPGGPLRCPRCGSPVDRSSLKSIGFWYQCNSCRQSFPRPNLSLVGIRSGKEVQPDGLVPVKETSYELAEEARGPLRQLLDLLDALERAASSAGYRASGPSKVKGRSGIEHEFCMSLEGRGGRMLVDLAICGDSSAIMRHLTKAFDASSESSVFLLVSPEVQDVALRALMSAALPGIRVSVIMANDPSELPALLARSL